jgi:hypothetical protein
LRLGDCESSAWPPRRPFHGLRLRLRLLVVVVVVEPCEPSVV